MVVLVEQIAARVEQIIREVCEEQQSEILRLEIMPDHVHLLLTPLRDERGWPYCLPSILKRLKGTSARSVNRLSGSCGPVWQAESFDHLLRSQESFEETLEYIRQNPVRRGLQKKPEDYPWLWVASP